MSEREIALTEEVDFLRERVKHLEQKVREHLEIRAELERVVKRMQAKPYEARTTPLSPPSSAW